MFSSKTAVWAVALCAVATLAAACGNSTPARSPAATSSTSAQPGLDATLATLTSIPTATLDHAGGGANTLTAITGQPPLTAAGKPEMFYAGAEYCPYCAAERWPAIIALSRFGSFTGLKPAYSSPSDVNASTPTWTFRDASYTSAYLTFDSWESKDVNDNPLRKPTDDERRLVKTYDAAPYVPADSAGSIPFLDLGNRYLASGSGYDPGVLGGLSRQQIVADLSDPNSPVARNILPIANQITAAICVITDNADHTPCSDPVILALEPKLG
jgi:hypothetical protein